MKMRRGQAFETMMLVISVIVALAILGVLTGILGGLQIGVTSAPDQAMHDQLKQVVSSGYGYSAPQKVTLKKGSTLDIRQVTKNDLPEISTVTGEQNVLFCVDSSIAAGTGANALLPITAPTGTFTSCSLGGAKGQATAATKLGPASQDVSFYFVVCGDSSYGSRGGYYIWIAGTQLIAGNCAPPH